MSDNVKHKDYEKATMYGKEGIYYNNYFFPLENLDKSPSVIKENIVKCISGSESYLGRCPGFCCLKGFYLTEKQMKSHECRRKQCTRFIRTPYSEDYWKKESDKKAMKKLKKQNSLYEQRNPNNNIKS